MKPLIQKLPLGRDNSFVAQTFRSPNFEVGWHQHVECELILFTEGSGLSFVGNHVGQFETGDIYLLGSNLPHSFQKREPRQIASAVVVQFTLDFWGGTFLSMPECQSISALLEEAASGLKVNEPCKTIIDPLVRRLETAEGFRRVLLLGECLEQIAAFRSYTSVSTQELKIINRKEKEMIDRIFQFTINQFRELITLSEVAELACMSVPAFCNYFKKRTKKTYIDFLNEIRIGFACKLLTETKKPVLEICFESGYNTAVNFHKHFNKVAGLSPLQYRKNFTARLALPQNNIYTSAE
jgi:AraC-like DNA-binding protein/quercetin dioxygenase-like cupin family protein